MYSEKELSKVSKLKRAYTARRNSSHSYIPSEEQASEREDNLNNFHKRKMFFKRNYLQKQCQENYRIYFSINQQKSSYQNLFEDKHRSKTKSKQNVYRRKMNKFQQKQQLICFKNQLSKVSRLQQILKTRAELTPVGKRHGMRQILTERLNKNQIQDRLSKNLQKLGQQFL